MSVLISLMALCNITSASAAYKVVKITDIDEAVRKGTVVTFCVADEYLYGPDNQNTAMGSVARVMSADNAVIGYKIEKKSEGNYLFRCVTPQGGDYKNWGAWEPFYLNSTNAELSVSFNLTLDDQFGRDMPNGGVWKINSDGSIQNVGSGLYLGGARMYSYPVTCSIVSIYDDSKEQEDEPMLESLIPFIVNQTVFSMKCGDKYLYGSGDQNAAWGDYETATDAENEVNGFRLEFENGKYRFRALHEGEDVRIWYRSPCYVNSQNTIDGVVFIMGKDQDLINGSSWLIEEVKGGYTVKNAAISAYLTPNGFSLTPEVFEFVTEKPIEKPKNLTVSAANVTVDYGANDISIPVKIENASECTTLGFSVVLPDEIEYVSSELANMYMATHSVFDGGKKRFLVSSDDNSVLNHDGDILYISIRSSVNKDAVKEARLTGIQLATKDYRLVELPDVVFTVTTKSDPNSIESVELDEDGITGIYTISGVQVPQMREGINIIRRADGKVIKVLSRSAEKLR